MMWRTPKITIVTRTIIRATVKSSKTKYLHWIMFVFSKMRPLLCVSMSSSCDVCPVHERAHTRAERRSEEERAQQYELIQSVCKFLQLLICTKRIFALLLDGSALMQLKYSVSMAYTFVSHIQYARIYFLRFGSCTLSPPPPPQCSPARRKIFNLNMYNASKKLPGISKKL